MNILNNSSPKKSYFLAKANANKKVLFEQVKHPISVVDVRKDAAALHGWKCVKIEDISNLEFYSFSKGESVVVDFGENVVGYVSMLLQTVGAPQDAPAHLRITLGEVPGEVGDQAAFDNYDGWLSSSWLQQEQFRIDLANGWFDMKRRYTFRYIKIEVLDTSEKYRIKFNQIKANTVTAADPLCSPEVTTTDKELAVIDRIAIKTLKNNMQDFYEDAPKRDQRLWIGDFWQTVRPNYLTYGNLALTRRCMYLFASGADRKGRVPADLFLVNDDVVPDNIYWLTWLLMYSDSLYDYYEASGDKETLQDLFPVAMDQIKHAVSLLCEEGLLPQFKFSQSNDDTNGGSFIDWNTEVDPQAPTQAVLIYTMKHMLELCDEFDDSEHANFLKEQLEITTKGALKHFWDRELKVFVSGQSRQISTISQIWFAKAGVLDSEQTKELLEKVINDKFTVRHVMPFNENIFIETLLENDLRAEGIKALKSYYGYMVENGADTFWEILDFENDKASPYGSYIINSYCHGWGAYPSYLIRKFGL